MYIIKIIIIIKISLFKYLTINLNYIIINSYLNSKYYN